MLISGIIKSVVRVGNDKVIMRLEADGKERKYFVDGGGDVINGNYRAYLQVCSHHGEKPYIFECGADENGNFGEMKIGGTTVFGDGNISVVR